MQLQIVIQLTAEPGKPGGKKPEDRRRESRIFFSKHLLSM